MRKIISILLILLLTFSLISCDSTNNNNDNDIFDEIDNIAEEIKIIKPTVSFDTNGGSAIKSYQTNLIENEPYTTRENYYFDGWYLDTTYNTPASFPLEIKHDTTLHAKWVLLKGILKSTNTGTIDSNIVETKGVYFEITPTGFEMQRLSELGFNMQISISYNVYYTKDYDVLWDIGYLGAPKFETYLKKSGENVVAKENQSATKNSKTYNITYKTSVSDLMNDDLVLQFSSDNIQNKLYFENIEVTYQCYK